MIRHTPKRNSDEDAFLIEKNLAHRALLSGNRETAWQHLNNLCRRLIRAEKTDETSFLVVSSALEFANVSFVLGKGFGNLPNILQEALACAEQIGDRRSIAMINLHLARLYYFGEKRDIAMPMFLTGKFQAEALGDDDIMTQAAEFIGLYYFIQGRFREAMGYFERAAQSFESEKHGRIINPSGPLWLSYCSAFLGQFHRATGTLDYYRRVAVEGADQSLATTLRAVLGIILLGIKKNREAYFHLSGALQEAIVTQNALAGYFAKGGLAFHHFMEGRLKEAWEWLGQVVEDGATSGLIRQYASPIVLEALYELHYRGINEISYLSFPTEFQRIMKEQNIHLQGVALRLKAMELIGKGGDAGGIKSDLEQSEELLVQSGDPIQLGKTRLEIARMNLRTGDADQARAFAEKARKDFSSYVDVFFPDDLRPLLTLRSDMILSWSDENLMNVFADVISELTPSTDFESLLTRTVKATNRFFGAERGGIFWFRRGGPQKGPVLRAACNLAPADIEHHDFKPNLSLVFKAFHENQPQVLRRGDFALNPSHVKAMLCVPFKVEENVRGVLYHDNSYVKDCFDNFSTDQLAQMARWLTSYVDHIFEFSRRLEQKVASQSIQADPPDAFEIVTRNSNMRRLLDQADRIAASDSTVLILGETGVGKELLARRIHQNSPRKTHPLVIVDPTVIPENLVESELFGYEKGAFTGADSQKIGRLEHAHNGTLFIDEIGEIPRSIQVKLLRAIQEKTMVRIGGMKTIYSDFRLVAATNRDLAEEVAAGRFREDLFYRLNVIPITLPPLRERIEDIPLLADLFLQRFSLKYNRRRLELTQEYKLQLTNYNWPGNIRELQNVVERAVLLSTDGELHLDFPSARPMTAKNFFDDLPSLDEIQRRYIRYVMEKSNGKISGPGGAADLLGMKRTSLYNRMKKLGIR